MIELYSDALKALVIIFTCLNTDQAGAVYILVVNNNTVECAAMSSHTA